MNRIKGLNLSEIALNDEEFKDLFSTIEAEILRTPFRHSEKLFRQHFAGFRIKNVKPVELQKACKKEFGKGNGKLMEFFFNAYIDRRIELKSFTLSPLFKTLLTKDPEIISTLKSAIETEQVEKKQQIEALELTEEELKATISKNINLSKRKIESLEAERNKNAQVQCAKDKEYDDQKAEIEGQVSEQQAIIVKAQQALATLKSKKQEIEKAQKEFKIEFKRNSSSLEAKINSILEEVSRLETEFHNNHHQKETRVLEQELTLLDENIEALGRLQIEIESIREELQEDQALDNDSDLVALIKSVNGDLTGYERRRFSKILDTLSSPLSKFEYRAPLELLPNLRAGGDATELTREAFVGWKLSERECNNSASIEYFSRFLFLQGYESLVNENYMNARRFLFASVRTNHHLIGRIEESQQIRDNSFALYLYSYLLEHKYESTNDLLDLLRPSFASHSFPSTLEVLVAHNMLQQVVDSVEELCSLSLDYAVQVFAENIVGDAHLFRRCFQMLATRLTPQKIDLRDFLLELLGQESNLPMVRQIAESISDNADDIDSLIEKLPAKHNDLKEKFILIIDSTCKDGKSSQRKESKKGEKIDILLRNMTTHVPLLVETSLVIEINNRSEQSLQNCILTVRSREENVKVPDPRVVIVALKRKSTSEHEFKLTLKSPWQRSLGNKQALFAISLIREKDGEQEQLALIDNSEVFFYHQTTEPVFYFTDGKPTQLNRNFIFGRDGEFEQIEKALRGQESDNTLMIFGERGVGKTTLWKTLEKDYFARHYDVIDIDFEGRNEKRIYKDIANQVCRALNLEQKILQKYDWRDEIIDDLIDLFNEVGSKYIPKINRNKKILLILDEFNAATDNYITGEWNSNFLGFIRQTMSKHSPWISIILCGVPSYREVMKNYNDPLYREGYPLLVERLSIEDTERLIKENAPNVEFHPKAIQAIINSVGTNPNYVHKFCRRLMDLLMKNPRGKNGKILCIRNDVFKNENICIREDFITFQNLIQIKGKGDVSDMEQIETLSAIATVSENTDEYVGIEAVTALYGKHQLPIPRSLEKDILVLLERELLEAEAFDNETLYRISPKMFKLWLIKNKPFRTIALSRASRESEAADIIGEDELSVQTRSILKSLFVRRDWLSIEPKRITSGYSNAETYVIHTQTRTKDPGRPFFVKIGQYKLIDEEMEKHGILEKLGIKIPRLFDRSATSPHSAPCLCDKNCPGDLCRTKYLGAVFEFANSYSGFEVRELGELIRRQDYSFQDLTVDLHVLFNSALNNFYCHLESKSKELKSWGYRSLSEPGINEVKSKFKNNYKHDFFVPSFDDKLIANDPVKFWREHIKPKLSHRRNMIAGRSHQDLHTGNVLKDNTKVVWVIDWRLFKTQGHLAHDFSLLLSSIVGKLDYSSSEIRQLSSIVTDRIQKTNLFEYSGNSTSQEQNIDKALCAIFHLYKHYGAVISRADLSLADERIQNEFLFSLFLNLLSTACSQKTSKFGGEFCVYLAGLISDKLQDYIHNAP